MKAMLLYVVGIVLIALAWCCIGYALGSNTDDAPDWRQGEYMQTKRTLEEVRTREGIYRKETFVKELKMDHKKPKPGEKKESF